MKQDLFISYSDSDSDKVKLIVNELKENLIFQPLVIASNRESLKPLVKKVTDGILKAKVVIPILTKNSIHTQWINQEIGYAMAIGEKIIPIVEKDLINSLKGFIHKEIDLPYNFLSNINKAKEHKEFINCFRILLSDLEDDILSIEGAVNLPKITEFDKNLEKVDNLNKLIEFQKLKKIFLYSPDGIIAAKEEILKLFATINEKVKKLREKKFQLGSEEDPNQLTYIVKSEGFSFSFAWESQYYNSLEGSYLLVRQWNGYIAKEGKNYYFPGDKPKLLKDLKYEFDRDINEEYYWLDLSSKKLFKSEQIVDNCFSWLVEIASNNKLKKY